MGKLLSQVCYDPGFVKADCRVEGGEGFLRGRCHFADCDGPGIAVGHCENSRNELSFWRKCYFGRGDFSFCLGLQGVFSARNGFYIKELIET